MKCKHILFMLFFLFSGCKEALLHDLTEVEANRYIGILHTEKIESEKEVQADLKWTINVDKKDFIKAVALLDSKRLLKDKANPKKETSSLLGSSQEKDFFHERALSSELEKTLLTMNGVYEARVHLNIEKQDLLNLKPEEQKQESAGVLMVVSDSEVFNEEKIKAIISGASGIKKENVSIVISKIQEKKEEIKEALKVGTKPQKTREIYLSTVNKNIGDGKKTSYFNVVVKPILKYVKYILIVLCSILLLYFFILFLKKKSKCKKLDLVKTMSMISR